MTYDTEEAGSSTSFVDHAGSKPRDGWDRSGQPSVAIVEAIAEATGRNPTALPPLYHSIEPDAIDALLTRGGQREGEVHVSFTYDGVLVSIGSDGDLSIRADGTTHESTTAAPETSEDLRAALTDLLRLASRNGVPVTGGYEIRNGSESPDLDVHITQVEKTGDGS